MSKQVISTSQSVGQSTANLVNVTYPAAGQVITSSSSGDMAWAPSIKVHTFTLRDFYEAMENDGDNYLLLYTYIRCFAAYNMGKVDDRKYRLSVFGRELAEAWDMGCEDGGSGVFYRDGDFTVHVNIRV